MKSAIFSALICIYTLVQLTGHASADALPIVKGDALAVSFKGIPPGEVAAHNGLYTVDDQGYIEMPYLRSRILAKGKTTSTLEKTIASLYKSAKIYPRVTITIQKNADTIQAQITVGGRRANRPGQFPYSRDMRLADAVALASPNSFFRGTIHLIRGSKTLTYDYNDEKSKSILLLPKDIVELVK